VNDTQQRIIVHDRQQLFVIGISGSSASLAALMWAASEARRRNAALRVVHVWEPVRRLAPYAVPVGSPAAAQDRLAACRLLTGAMRETFGPATPDGVTTELAEGAPERLLVRRSTGADLLVLGATASLDDPQTVFRTGRTRLPGECPLPLDDHRYRRRASGHTLGRHAEYLTVRHQTRALPPEGGKRPWPAGPLRGPAWWRSECHERRACGASSQPHSSSWTKNIRSVPRRWAMVAVVTCGLFCPGAGRATACSPQPARCWSPAPAVRAASKRGSGGGDPGARGLA